ncbi:MAG: hypothetical protein QNJ40_08220 [Xanthomonadales bacterium]|nr:hypothetical protein [Xanthomonadales bacterium]
MPVDQLIQAVLSPQGVVVMAAVVLALEMLVLSVVHYRTGLGLRPAEIVLAKLPGLMLLFALLEALSGNSWGMTGAYLAAALLFNIVDVVLRQKKALQAARDTDAEA